MKKIVYVFSLLIGLLLTGCEVELPETMGSIYGIVGDMENGEPIRGASVILSPSNRSTVTGSDGHFEFLNLEASQYKIQVSAKGYMTNSRQITVLAGSSASGDIMMRQTTAQMSVSTEELDFGTNETSLTFDVISKGDKQVEWTVKEDIDWLTCSPSTGKVTNASSTVVVTVDRDDLEDGVYKELLVVSSKDEKVADKTIVVKLTVNRNVLKVEPSELDFGASETTLPIKLKNTSNKSLKYTVESSNDWLVPSKASGTIASGATDNLKAIVSRSGLAVASYTAALTFSFEGGSVSVPVTMTVEDLMAPVVTLESSVDNIGYNRATVRGMIADLGSTKVTRYGFCWAEQANPTADTNCVNLGNCAEPQSFEAVITGLQPNTTYHLRAYAENSVGISYSGNEITFTTHDVPVLATVKTGEVSNVNHSSATVDGEISSLGNVEKLTAYGHVWSTSASQAVVGVGESTNYGALSEVRTFNSVLSGLKEKTTYYVRAYATNEMGTAYGEIVEFTTEKSPFEDVTSGLYAYYTFEENTKSTVEGAYKATPINAPTYVESMNGTKAIKFSSMDNSYISVPEPMIDGGTFTVSFWIKGLSDGHLFHVPSNDQWLGTSKYVDSFLMIMRNGKLTFYPDGWYGWIFAHPTIDASEWTMVTLTSSYGNYNSTTKLYINGDFVDVSNRVEWNHDVKNRGVKFIFGGSYNDINNTKFNAINMTVDNLRIYNARALSDAEVEQIYKYESQ